MKDPVRVVQAEGSGLPSPQQGLHIYCSYSSPSRGGSTAPSRKSEERFVGGTNFGIGNCPRNFVIFSCREQIKKACHSALLRPAVPCLNFVTEITGGQSTLLGGRACPEVASLREFDLNLRIVLVRSCAWWVLRFSGVFGVLAENGFHGRMCLK